MAKQEKLIRHLPPVRLTDEQWSGLGEASAYTDTPVSDHVRAAIDAYLLIFRHTKIMRERLERGK